MLMDAYCIGLPPLVDAQLNRDLSIAIRQPRVNTPGAWSATLPHSCPAGAGEVASGGQHHERKRDTKQKPTSRPDQNRGDGHPSQSKPSSCSPPSAQKAMIAPVPVIGEFLRGSRDFHFTTLPGESDLRAKARHAGTRTVREPAKLLIARSLRRRREFAALPPRDDKCRCAASGL